MVQQISLVKTPQPAKVSTVQKSGSADSETDSFSTILQEVSHTKVQKPESGKQDAGKTPEDKSDSTESKKADSANVTVAAVSVPQNGAPVPAAQAAPEAQGMDLPLNPLPASDAEVLSALQAVGLQQADIQAEQVSVPSQAAPDPKSSVAGQKAEASLPLAQPEKPQTFSNVQAQAMKTGQAEAQPSTLEAGSDQQGKSAVKAAVGSSGSAVQPETAGQPSQTAEAVQNSRQTAGTAETEKAGSGSVKAAEKKTDSAAAAQPQSVSSLYSDGKVVVQVSSDGAKTNSLSAGRQVADAVSAGIKQGKQEFQIELYPQSLGRVSVKLSSEGGMLTVVIEASNPKTQSLLMSSSGEIRSILHASSGQAVQVAKPEQNTNPNAQWYAQQGGSGQQFSQQQQQQGAGNRKNSAGWFRVGGASAVSTGDFLSMLQQSAGL